MCFYASWRNFANMVSLANSTITMRTASQFCARGRSQNQNILDLDPRSRIISRSENLGQNVTDDSRIASAIFVIIEIHSLQGAGIHTWLWLWL